MTMSQFLLLLHESPTDSDELSPGEIQKIIEEYGRWRDELEAKGRLVGSHKLCDDGGKHVVADNGQLRITDGPFSESKEVVGGYFMIEAETYEEAIEISRDCPHLRFGGRIEIRQIDALDG